MAQVCTRLTPRKAAPVVAAALVAAAVVAACSFRLVHIWHYYMCFSIVFRARLVDLMAPVAAVAAPSFPLVAAAVVVAPVVAAPVVTAPVVAAAGSLTWLE